MIDIISIRSGSSDGLSLDSFLSFHSTFIPRTLVPLNDNSSDASSVALPSDDLSYSTSDRYLQLDNNDKIDSPTTATSYSTSMLMFRRLRKKSLGKQRAYLYVGCSIHNIFFNRSGRI